MKSRLPGFVLSLCSLLFSLQSQGQATCIAVIDSTRTEFCIGSGPVTFVNARAVGENIEWISLGDGVFDNRFAVNPTYTPGSRDRSNGYAYILLDVYKDDTVDFCSQLPWVRLNLGSMAATATPSSQGICTGASITNIVLSSGLTGATYRWTRDNTSTVTGIAASGTGNISGSLTNNTGAPVTVTFTITASNTSCTGTPVTATVVVSPRPNAVASISSQTICSGATITPIAFSGNLPGTVYNWTRNNTSSITGIASSGSGNIAGIMTRRSGFSTTTVTFTVTPNLNGCTGSSITSTVAVNTSTVSVTGTPSAQTVCTGTPITTIVPSGGSSGTYNWTRNNTTAVTGIAASGTGSISGTLNNTTASPAYVTFTITRGTSSCSNRATVLVNPVPTATVAPLSQSICSGTGMETINLSGNITGAVYNWTRNNTASVTGVAASGSGNISGTLVNNTNSPVTVTFTITPTVNGCLGQPVTATVRVNPRPTAVLSGSQAACAGASLPQLGIALTGAAPWSITYTNGTTPVTVSSNTSPYLFTVPATVNTYTLVNVSDANCAAQQAGLSGTAVISQAVYGISATAGANGSITPAGVSNVNCGDNQTYLITPAPGFIIGDVLVDGISAGAVSSYTFTNVTATHSISALFTANNVVITASAGNNGSINPAGQIPVAAGSSQVFTITADNCYRISDVLVDGISVGAVSSYTFTNVSQSHTISAAFERINYSIAASAGANGNISNAGTNVVNCGNDQTYTITASEGFSVQDVLVDGVSVGAVSSYTFSAVSASHTIHAVFSAGVFSITASAGSNGAITPAGTISVAGGGSQTYVITPNSCYEVADVLVDGVSVGAVSSYTFNNVTAAHTISASFTVITHAITASADANGTITPAGISNINCGGSQTYSIVPNTGFAIQSVIVNGVSVGAVSSYTFNNVTAPHSISVVFTAVSNCALRASATVAAMACNASTTTITVTTSGATGTRQFSLNGGAYQTSGVFTVTAAGSPYVVTVRDAATGCLANTNTITVSPAPTAIPSTPTGIDGPVYGLCSGGNFTYTVQPVAGATSYVWSAPAGFSIVSGQGTPQVVLAVPAGFTGSPGLWAVSKNSCGSTTGFRLALSSLQSIPVANITGPSSVTAAQAGVEYSVPAESGSTYNWQVPAGSSITAGQGTASITVTFGSTSGNVSVAVTNGCGTGPRTNKAITVVPGSNTFTITANAGSNGTVTPLGAVSVTSGASQTYVITPNSCYQVADVLVDGVSVGAVSSYTFNNVTAAHTISASFTVITYAITASADANGTITPAGISNVNCGGSQTYSIVPNTGFAIQSVIVNGVSVGAVSSYTFNNVTAPHSISVVFTAVSNCALRASATVAAMACNASTTTITVTTSGATGTRQFSLNGGAYQTSGVFTVTAAGSPYVVTVRDAATGCLANTNTITVSPAPTAIPSTPTGIDGPVYGLCSGGNFTYTVQPVAGATSYVWSAPAGFSIVSGQGTPQVVLAVPAGFTGSPGLWAVSKNSCGSTTGFRLALSSLQSIPVANITGPSSVTAAQAGVEYSVPAESGSTYNWQVPAGSSITAGQGTNSITVTFGSTSGNVSVAVTNGCGTGPRTNKPVSFVLTRPSITQATTAAVNNILKTSFSIYPNPVYHNAAIIFSYPKAGEKYSISISSSTGNTVYAATKVTMAGQNSLQLDLSKLRPGVYVVRLIADGESQVIKFIKGEQ